MSRCTLLPAGMPWLEMGPGRGEPPEGMIGKACVGWRLKPSDVNPPGSPLLPASPAHPDESLDPATPRDADEPSLEMASLSELPRADAAARNLVIRPPLPLTRTGIALTTLPPLPLSCALALAETACELGDDEVNVSGVAESVAEFAIDSTGMQAARTAVETIRLITSDSGCISLVRGYRCGDRTVWADPQDEMAPPPKIAPDRDPEPYK